MGCFIHTGGHSTKDANSEGVWSIRLRVPSRPRRHRPAARAGERSLNTQTRLPRNGREASSRLWPRGEREILLLDPGGVTVGSQGHFAPGKNPAHHDRPPPRIGRGGREFSAHDPGAAKPPLAMYLRPLRGRTRVKITFKPGSCFRRVPYQGNGLKSIATRARSPCSSKLNPNWPS